MSSVAIRGLFTRKLRTILTMIAIVLGVSMIAGTYVLTDTINQSFSHIFSQANRHLDVVISGKQPVSSSFSRPPSLPASLLTIVKNSPGVSAAEGGIADTAQLFDRNGKQLGGMGAPNLLFSHAGARFGATSLIAGHAPHGREMLLDTDTVKRSHLHLGDTIGIAAAGPLEKFKLVGITRFGSVGSIGGASLISVDLPVAQKLTQKQGKFDQISVIANPGVSQSQLATTLQTRIPPALRNHVDVKTAQQNATDQTNALGTALNFLTIALLAFGGISVFVGAFIIFNTFSITVAQRTREFGMLRTLGATRRQVLTSVILEALVIGLLSSIVGLFAGLGIAKGLNALFVAFGIDLPNAGMVLATRTILVAMLVGTIVTLAASIMPAIRATRVPPIAALREGATLPRGRFARFTPIIATGLTAIGILVLVYGIFASIDSTTQRLSSIGLGAIILFLGVAMLSPRLVVPIASVVGWPIERMTTITGRLARENAVRNPSRTAVTAAALMIGLALVGFVTIFAAELTKTAGDAVSREVAGNFAVYGQRDLMPQGVQSVVAKVPGVGVTSAVKLDSASIAGIGDTETNGIQPVTLARVYHFQWIQGSAATLTGMRPYDALIADDFAKSHKLHIGSPLQVTTTAGAHDTFTVSGVYKSSQFLSNWCIRYDTMSKDWQLNRDRLVMVNVAQGQNLNTAKSNITAALSSTYPSVSVHSQDDIKKEQSKNVNQLLYLIYVLLAMSVVVSLFGIINTLVLSVYERTREIGMLRAIGTSRAQVRWIIRWESVITAVIGAVLGLILGIVLAVLITLGLSSQGIEFALPIGQLLIWVVFAMIFGIVAAAFPARRAARLDVLQAISYE